MRKGKIKINKEIVTKVFEKIGVTRMVGIKSAWKRWGIGIIMNSIAYLEEAYSNSSRWLEYESR